jgi:iron complex outermembrane receptor protein
MKLLTADMFEVGYRGTISSSLNVDVEIFDIRARNASVMVTGNSFSRTEGANTVVEEPIVSTNLPLKLHQQGITLSLNYSTKKLQVKPFVTMQRTRIRDYAPYHNMPDAIPGVSTNIYSGMGTEAAHKSTPSIFGGASINYVPTSKININLNNYYYSAQTYHHLSNTLFNDGVRGIDTISAKLTVNLTASYEPVQGFHIFISGKNLLNSRVREFYRSDEVPFRLMAGINYEF